MPQLKRIVGTALLVLGLAFAAGSEAASGYRPPEAKDVAGWFPAGLVARLPDQRGTARWRANEWRVTEITVPGDGRWVALEVTTNGLFEENWPFARILGVVMARVCGIEERALGQRLVDRMYKSPSLIEGEELGGNAGRTFRRRVRHEAKGCRVTVDGKGARWHTVRAEIRPAR